jgi:hypothetical protein
MAFTEDDSCDYCHDKGWYLMDGKREECFCVSEGKMDFGDAIRELKAGNKVRRAGWNGKGMWLALMPEFVVPEAMVNGRTKKHAPAGDLNCGAYIVMWTAQGVWQPGWLASQADMLSDDWEVVDDPQP